jgi:hypothetical protein
MAGMRQCIADISLLSYHDVTDHSTSTKSPVRRALPSTSSKGSHTSLHRNIGRGHRVMSFANDKRFGFVDRGQEVGVQEGNESRTKRGG